MQLHEAEPALKASPKQTARILLAKLGVGPYYARLGVEAEIADRQLGILDEPSSKDLTKLLKQVIDARTMEDRYKLLLQPVPYPNKDSKPDRPELWFDYIEELTSEDIVEGIGKTALELLPQDKSTYDKAVDLGAGIGYLGATLIGSNKLPRVADSVTLVDVSPAMLAAAADRYGPVMDQVQADVTKLPFADQSFDLIASAGLVYGLGTELQEPYFKEVSRILQPGGIYLDGDYLGGHRHSSARSVPRLQLGYLVKAHASLEMPFDPLVNVKDKAAYFEQFGLKLSYKEYVDDTSGNNIQIRILKKTS